MPVDVLDLEEVIVGCVHSTRRTRRDAPTSRETRCETCSASILVNPITDDYGAGRRLHLLCSGCVAEIAEPDEIVAGILPGTIEEIAPHVGGIEQATEMIELYRHRPVRDLAAAAFRNTVGGQG